MLLVSAGKDVNEYTLSDQHLMYRQHQFQVDEYINVGGSWTHR